MNVQGSSKYVENCSIHECVACEFEKVNLRTSKDRYVVRLLDKDMDLKKDYLNPGQRVSVNHYQSKVPGRMYNCRGITDIKDL